jgi:hypothetical protein
MTSPMLFHGREATIMVCNAIASPATTTTMYAQIDADGSDVTISGWIKDFTISGAEGDLEVVNELGETSNFQNQLLEKKPFGLVELSGTLVLSAVAADRGVNTLLYQDDTTAGTSITSGYKRYQYGSSASGQVRVAKGIGMQLTDGTNYVEISLNNAYLNKTGEIKVAADGHVECSITAKCLVKDYYEEYNNA